MDCGFEGFDVAELADEDHVGVFAHEGTECGLEIAGVDADFTLVDGAEDIFVDEFDGVFETDDVIAPGPVDDVDDRCERRGFTAAGGAGYEDESAAE